MGRTINIMVFTLVILRGVAFGQGCTITFAGHITEVNTKNGHSGASVFLSGVDSSFLTRKNGEFIFKRLCPGTYNMMVVCQGYDTLMEKIELTKDLHISFSLNRAHVLEEVTVSSQTRASQAGVKTELSERDMQETKGQSLAEALTRINGVTLLQTGSNIAKPVINGLHSSRILTINNGIRQEGQQWGNEHAPEIDPFIAGRLVVLKGAEALKYGSDAIAGVILVEPKALRSEPGYNAEINSVYFTNNRQYVFSGVWEQQLRKAPAFRYRIQGTFKKGASTATPDYVLNNTASEEKNFSITAGYNKAALNTELYYSFFKTRIGIFTGSHIGNITDLQNAIAADKPDETFLGERNYDIQRPSQNVTHHLLKLKSSIANKEHIINLVAGAQFNKRQEFDIVRSSTNTRPQIDLSVSTFTQELNWEQRKKNDVSFIAGIALMEQNNTYSGRYFIPNYFSFTAGGYFIERWNRNRWDIQAGIRFDHKSIQTTRLKFNSDTVNYDFAFTTQAASLNTVYRAGEYWKINVTLSLASRAPYVNELLSDGIHHGTATYEKGDINLKPERALNISAGANFQNHFRTWQAEISVYANHISDFIYQQPRPESPVLTIAGAFPLIEYRQTNALLTGFDFTNTVRPFGWLSWQGHLSVLYARNTTLKDWLILMPANRLNNEVTFDFRDGKMFSKTYVSVSHLYVMRQKNVPSDINGKQDYKPAPPAYHLLGVQFSTDVVLGTRKLTFGIGIRNALNTAYRDYLNGQRYFTDETGRNISFSIKIPFNHVYQKHPITLNQKK